MSITTVDRDPINASAAWPSIVRLAASGAALILAFPTDALPVVLHWGADPGDLDERELRLLEQASRAPLATNGVDRGVSVSILPEGWTGWTGTVGLAGHRGGRDWSPKFVPVTISVDEQRAGEGGSIVIDAEDREAGLELRLDIQQEASGLVRLRAAVRNVGASGYWVEGLQLALPVPTRADVLHDLAGRWGKERVPQQRAFTVGSHLREGRHGRTGADAATLLTAGTTDLDFASGEGWGIHVAFSGNHRLVAERAFSGERLLLGGELLLPGEIVLAPGEAYESPWVYASYGAGHDAVAARFHEYLRARPSHPQTPRPVVMNVWEAVYFDQDLDRLTELADLAAGVGVERFVLDDGWFSTRRDDTSGLGDWTLSEEVWGEGRFARLVEAVRSRGMQFGLWFEPEMVNPDSDLARSHPDWLLQVPGRLPVEARKQQVLDLTHPGAYAHLRDQISHLVAEYGIDYLKWDHNRDLIDAGSTRTGHAGVHEQTLATYRLMDEIRRTFPALEIESCSSGGARVDLGILEHTDRVWASDCIDAHERQQIQRWTAQLLPPELVGSHVGADRAHTTGRRLDLPFRAATALFGHFGIEWNLAEATAAERALLGEWVAYYREVRDLVHTGTVHRRSLEGGDLWLHGAVRPDRSEALYSVTLRDRHVTWPAGRVRLPGLDRDRTYRVVPDGPRARDAFVPQIHPTWWASGVEFSGALLADIGLPFPAMNVDEAVLVKAVRLP
ncbi:alpha-galactosidase [Agromyces sp. MMS24-K17]|uniref:alpha-galactosidase n=1 Tax=Agromyces sp. MMS24-K17 TaxID=3372850 RepID=UPI0037545C14